MTESIIAKTLSGIPPVRCSLNRSIQMSRTNDCPALALAIEAAHIIQALEALDQEHPSDRPKR